MYSLCTRAKEQLNRLEETAKAAQLHETASVLEQEYTENGAVMKVILPVEDLEAYNEYILKSE